MESLTLVVNPGSASRKYALFAKQTCIASLHFEYDKTTIICTLRLDSRQKVIVTDLSTLSQTTALLRSFLTTHTPLNPAQITAIGVRVVAPGAAFLEDVRVTDTYIQNLEAIKERAPLHIMGVLGELKELTNQFPNVPLFAISDSAFHRSKPDYAWNYGLPLEDADRLDVKRFGYHGISLSGVVETLTKKHKLVPRLIVCHLGSGASVSALYNGQGIDTTMGYSPLEGLIMATRVGSIDPTATHVLKAALALNDEQLETYLNHKSGLFGLSGTTSDIRELLEQESSNHRAHLALQTYVHAAQKAVGQMCAVLGGVDLLVFTGTVGERSAVIRERILTPFHFVDLTLDAAKNAACLHPADLTLIHRTAHSKPIMIIPTDEAAIIARRTRTLST